MNRSFLLIILLFLFPSDQFQAQTAKSNETNPEAKRLYDDGIERLEMGQVSEAVERFQKALKIDPEYVAAYSGLGRAFFKLRQWDNASETFRRALALKAKKRENENKPQNNDIRSTEPRTAPTAPTAPATKPKGTSSNKPLPTLPLNRVMPRLGPAPKPPPVSQAVSGAVAKFDDRLGSPPPEVRESADAVQPPAASGAPISPSPIQPTPAKVDVQVAMNVTPLTPPGEAKSVSALTDEIALTTIYRVGAQDVLEIRLNSSQPQQPTAFKITRSGMLEHPQLSGPLPVTGLTVEEISARIENDLKSQAAIQNPKAFVGVVEYASHPLEVDGLVKNPGTKSLKSEAIALAAVVAEAQPLPQAARVTVVRNGTQVLETDLNHTADAPLLVRPGDVVTLHPEIDEFLYVEGKVRFPGEKTYRVGLTLMQAIIMAGGTTSKSTVAEIIREGEEVVRTRFDLKAIQAGKAADPLIKARDRIILH
jgi:protein involved in polysaccharide export with SLBB domain